jgi:hypothetical protein
LIIGDLRPTSSFRKLVIFIALLVMLGTGGCVGLAHQSASTASSSDTGNTSSNPTGAAMLSVSSPSLSFGNVQVGNATAQLISVTNTGSANLLISAVSTAGTGFGISGYANMTLAPSQSLTMAVNFAPAAPGDVAGTLLVSSNAVNSKVQVGLSGTGITASASGHSVMLSWTPSTSQVIGYFIYRSSVSGGPFVQLNSSPDPNPSYTDSGLASGSYFYVVASVDIDDVTSAFSNEVEVVIP